MAKNKSLRMMVRDGEFGRVGRTETKQKRRVRRFESAEEVVELFGSRRELREFASDSRL